MRLIGALAMAVAMSACGAVLPASAERQGDCTLVLRDGQGLALDPPYRVALVPVPGAPPDAVVMYEAEGWGDTTITVTDPAGGRTTSGFDADSFNSELAGSTVDQVGTWHAALSDTRGCAESFEIEVARAP